MRELMSSPQARAIRGRLLDLWRALLLTLTSPLRRPREAGMTTTEYAVGTIAAAGFAAILYQVVTGDSIITGLGDLISRALSSI